MANTDVPGGGRQVAWHLARNIVAHKLDHDARILPSQVVTPYMQRVDHALTRVLTTVVGKPIHRQLLRLISLPQALAGLSVSFSTDSAPMARMAALIEDGPALRDAIRHLDHLAGSMESTKKSTTTNGIQPNFARIRSTSEDTASPKTSPCPWHSSFMHARPSPPKTYSAPTSARRPKHASWTSGPTALQTTTRAC